MLNCSLLDAHSLMLIAHCSNIYCMDSRPKIKVPLTGKDIAIEKISMLLLIFIWAFTIFSYIKLPEIVPIHFDASGKPDSYGNKWTLFILPLIASVLYIGMNFLNKYPWVFNYMVPITEVNAESQYSAATRMIRVLKCSMMLIFGIISLYSYWTADGKSDLPGWWFLPLILGIIFIPLIYLILKSPRE